MELLLSGDVPLNYVTRELIEDATRLADHINQARPLPSETIAIIQSDLLGLQVYNSNAIEGSSITLRETRQILETGGLVDVGRQREATETRNLGRATAEIQTMVGDSASWSDLDRFTVVHQTLMADVMDEGAGVIRSTRVMIAGARHQPPNPAKLDSLLQRLFDVLKEEKQVHPIYLATWIHWSIARIHPFLDGNGRMARLWQDLILFGHRYTAAIIRRQDREEYYEALGSADEGDFNPLTQLVARSLIRTLQVYANAHREVDEIKAWASEIAAGSRARHEEHRTLAYHRWVAEMEKLRDAFERCARQLTIAADRTFQIRLRSFEIVDQATWETLGAGGPVASPWYFWVDFQRDDQRVEYCFHFGRHLASSQEGGDVFLLVREGGGDRPAGQESVSTLRGLLLRDGKLARKRFDVEQNDIVDDLEIDPLDVARGFMEEVLRERMG